MSFHAYFRKVKHVLPSTLLQRFSIYGRCHWYALALIATLLVAVCCDIVTTTPSYKSVVVKPPWSSNWAWNDCDDLYFNRTEALYHQLADIVAVLDHHDVLYTVAGGTLIGVMRDYGMNPNEIDNDIHILEPNFRFTRQMRQDLYDRKLIILWDDCCRICRRLDEGQSRRSHFVLRPLYYFWGYFPYTDVGNIGAAKASYGIESEAARSLWEKSGNELVQRQIGDIWVSTPNDEVTNLWLNDLFGNWTTPVSKIGDFLAHLV